MSQDQEFVEDEGEEQKEPDFMENLQANTQNLYKRPKKDGKDDIESEGRMLDAIGYESNLDQLNVWLGYQRAKIDNMPMSGLQEKLKEVAGLFPILQKVFGRQVDIDNRLSLLEFMPMSGKFLTQENFDVDYQEFQNRIIKLINERLD